MTDDVLRDILSLADDEFIAAADPTKEKTPARLFPVKRALLIAAALAVLASATAIIADAMEYNRAVVYLTEHSISTDGMTRSEIKEVYWNIKNSSWNIETADFTDIDSSGSNRLFVSGHEILMPRPSQELFDRYASNGDISNIYVTDSYVNDDGYLVIVTSDGKTQISEKKAEEYEKESSVTSIDYNGRQYYINKSDFIGTHYVLQYDSVDGVRTSTVFKFVNGGVAWAYTFKADYAKSYMDLVETDGYLAVSGQTSRTTDNPDSNSFVVFLTKDGSPMRTVTHGEYEHIAAMFQSGDGLIVFTYSFSSGDLDSRIVTMRAYEYGRDGKAVGKVSHTVSGPVRCFNKFGGGYTFMVNGQNQQEIGFADAHGNVINTFVYAYPGLTDNDITVSALTDISIAEHSGKLYVSATLSNRLAIDYDDLTQSCRDTVSCVLFVCDPENGFEDYYLIRSCVGGAVKVVDGKLRWRVGSILGAQSVTMGRCSVIGSAEIYDVFFDGAAVTALDTGETGGWDNGSWASDWENHSNEIKFR